MFGVNSLNLEFKQMKTNNTKENWEFKNKKSDIENIIDNSKFIKFKPCFDLESNEFELELDMLEKQNNKSRSLIKQKWSNYYFKMLNSNWKLIRNTLLYNGFKEVSSLESNWTVLWSSKPLKNIYQFLTKYQ